MNENEVWRTFINRILNADMVQLRKEDWTPPNLIPKWAFKVQESGYNIFGEEFKFVPFDLKQFSLSLPDSRSKDEAGNVIFATVPILDSNLIVYSATADPEFVKARLGIDLANPFQGTNFLHPGTQWFNIASRIGMMKFFNQHSPQILDFFSGLIARRLREGKRIALVSKKRFKKHCADQIRNRLKEYGFENVQIVIDDWEKADLNNPLTIPLIHYGVIGINLFQDYDAIYCLNGYYVNEQVIRTVLQGIIPPGQKINIQLETVGMPLRRRAFFIDDTKSPPPIDDEQLAMMALRQQEIDTVLQAVGRVRPYTSPREVITFQCASHPRMEYTREFNNLEEIRAYFHIPKSRDRHKDSNMNQIKQARRRGLSQRQAAAELGLSIRTVKRYWNS